MKNTLLIFTATILLAACNRSAGNRDDVEKILKRTMQHYLYEKINFDSSKAKYDVQDVTFFEDNDFYECEFKVRMQSAGSDTTGYMNARVLKDMKTVMRRS
ncbi:hypothetical protein [Foetidibacter luteolus]|uniref:hypothetical protein n=1 Tax=Foetidibacter luteolus TaxID=2608880 RepID=UPI00129AF24E|nr:hypothetical protein [Foetidibacter luteolus]